MLIAILLFMLSSVYIISLVGNAIDKPKEAGIFNDLLYYESTGELLLLSASDEELATGVKTILNNDLDSHTLFGVDNVTKKKNAYKHPYTLEIQETLVPLKTSIIISTRGKNRDDIYKIIVIKEGTTIDSCTTGFGRKDRNLEILASSLCASDATPVTPVDPEDPVPPEEPVPPPPPPPPVFVPVTVVPAGCTGIYTALDLYNVRKYLDDCYIIMNPIDLAVYPNWIPIRSTKGLPFTATFDGQMYPITNLKINRPTENYVGLFDYVVGTTIKNVVLKDINIVGKQYVGGVISYADTITLENSHVTGSVKASLWATGSLIGATYDTTIRDSTSNTTVTSTDGGVGGLTGFMEDSTILNSHTSGIMTGAYEVGGLIGCAFTDNGKNVIMNSYTDASVFSKGWGSGGLIGFAENLEVSDSYSTGNVDLVAGAVDVSAGGFIGAAEKVTIKDSYSTGNVKGSDNVGGFIGVIDINPATIERSYATGNVHNIDSLDPSFVQHTGGFIGAVYSPTTIKDSYSRGNVTAALPGANDSVASFIGSLSANSTLTNIYSTGTASGTPTTGLFITRTFTTLVYNITGAFYDQQLSGLPPATYGTPLTTAKMKQKTSFPTYDFTNVWKIQEGVGYPILR
jgi:hypothetical protein